MKVSLSRSPYLDAIVILAYAALTLLLTYPLIENFTTHVLGRDDVYVSIWDLWWAKKAFLDLHTSPYSTQYVFHPTGVNLALHSLDLFNGILSIPLQMMLNLATTYNILMVAGFVLSGYGMFLLTKYLTGDSRASFVSGLIFAFCPYKFAHILGGHFDVVSTQFIPFYILYLLKTEKEGGKKNALLAAVFLVATSLCCWHYLVFMAAFTALLVFYRIWFEREKTAAVLRRFTALTVIFGLLILPFAYPILVESISGKYKKMPLEWSVTFSADVLGYIVPSAQHPLFRTGYVKDIQDRLTGNAYESTLFLGYSVMILAAYYVMKHDPLGKWINARVSLAKAMFAKNAAAFGILFAILICIMAFFSWLFAFGAFFWLVILAYSMTALILVYVMRDRQIGFWPLSVVFFFILSLGPFLHIYGEVYPLPLPYLAVPFIPLLSAARDPARLGIVVMLSMAVIASYALKDFSGRIRRRDMFFAAVSVVIILEFLSVPCVLADLTMPAFYSELAKDKGDYAILEVPLPRTTTLYYQTQHEKKLVGGYIAIYPIGFYVFNQNLPVIPNFILPVTLSDYVGSLTIVKDGYYRPAQEYEMLLQEYCSATNFTVIGEFGPLYGPSDGLKESALLSLDQSYAQGDIVKQNISRIGAGVLEYYNIKYIIVHEDELGAPEKKAVKRLLTEILPDAAPVYAGEGMAVYAIPKTGPVSFAILGRGWYPKEPLEHEATRWMSENASIKAIGSSGGPIRLDFLVRSSERPRKLIVYLNDRRIGEYQVGLNDTSIRIGGLNFVSGNNTITFYAPGGCAEQKNRFMTIGEDKYRCVSFAFQNVSITPEEGA